MPRYPVFVLLSLVFLAGCERVHLIQDLPPSLRRLPISRRTTSTRAGSNRLRSVPRDSNRVLVAMEFGGLWGTVNGGETWFRIFSLPAVMVRDVEFGDDGTTVIATVFRDNQVINGGGIYVSRDRGGSWTRPATGVVPPDASFTRTSAYGISRAPDEPGLWYVGTDFGVAISTDNGATWTHKGSRRPFSPMVQAVLAFPRGQALALATGGLYRSDDRGGTWRKVISDSFGFQAQLRRQPDGPLTLSPWAFILREYHCGDAGQSLRHALVLRARHGHELW